MIAGKCRTQLTIFVKHELSMALLGQIMEYCHTSYVCLKLYAVKAVYSTNFTLDSREVEQPASVIQAMTESRQWNIEAPYEIRHAQPS